MDFQTTFGRYGLGYLAAAIAMALLDFGWIALVGGPMFRQAFGGMLLAVPRAVPALAFYLLYPAALLFLVHGAGDTSWTGVAVRGAVTGVLAYGTFDLSLLALFKSYTPVAAVTDMAWGTVLSAVVATVGTVVAARFGS